MPKMQATTTEAEGKSLGTPPTDDIPEDFDTPITVLVGPEGQEEEQPVDTATMIDPKKADLIEMVNEVFQAEGEAAVNLDTALYKVTRHCLNVIKHLDAGFQKATDAINREALMAMARALERHSPTTPYKAEIRAIAPSGYAITFSVEERNHEAFLKATGELLGWLKAKGFQPEGVML